jgi:hypothetical protein
MERWKGWNEILTLNTLPAFSGFAEPRRISFRGETSRGSEKFFGLTNVNGGYNCIELLL